MKSLDYMRAYVYCNNGIHPDLIVYIPLVTATPYIFRNRTCPICDTSARVVKAKPIFNLGYRKINEKELLRKHAENKPAGDIIHLVQCITCDGLSLVDQFGLWDTEKLDKNLEISACPVCGSNELKIYKSDIELIKEEKLFPW
jgi:hypothetical protein